MAKPTVMTGYDDRVTAECERVLVTLLRGLGPWRTSIYLIGGLAPRYIVTAKPPSVPIHAGTGDIDIVVDLAIITETEAYQTLEDNLKRMNFEREKNTRGELVNWRWKIKTERGTTVVVELLADDPKLGGGRLQELPTKGNVSAINIPNAAMVFDHHQTIDVTADLLNDGCKATETIRYADIVSFTVLKALAFDQRNERKDAHDLAYCLENFVGGSDMTVDAFKQALKGKHAETIRGSLAILRSRFCDDDKASGFEKDGPVAVARFEIEGDGDEAREARILRQRVVSETISQLLQRIEES